MGCGEVKDVSGVVVTTQIFNDNQKERVQRVTDSTSGMSIIT